MLVLTLSIWSVSTRLCQADGTIGVAEQRPASGRFVETEQGFMVAYQATIPGTDVTFGMVPVPGGELTLEPDGSPDSQPLQVNIPPFWIGRCEVSWAEYNEFDALREKFRERSRVERKPADSNAHGAVTAPTEVYESRFPNVPLEEIPKHPAVSMRQYGAKQYTKWLSLVTENFYRLPSHVEWEYACRAGRQYSFGDKPERLAGYGWYFDNSAEGTRPIGTKRPNIWGLHDMHGNAAEWVLDLAVPNRTTVLRALVSSGKPPIIWPTGEFSRVVCGGSWSSDANECSSRSQQISTAKWIEYDPSIRASPCWLACDRQREIGFRILRPLLPPPEHERGRYWDADCTAVRQAVAMSIAGGRSQRRRLTD
jgi:formylglycine-generating enzyme required for sulfatase activity